EDLVLTLADQPTQTSEARKAALDAAVRYCDDARDQPISTLEFVNAIFDLPEVRTLQQPDTSEAVRKWQPIEGAPKKGRYIGAIYAHGVLGDHVCDYITEHYNLTRKGE